MKITSWKMEFLNYEPLECTAPCSMYSVLLEHKKIDDPFYGMNEQEAKNLSEEDCSFYTTFNVTAEDYEKDHIELTFYGLDTICEIYLNGKLLDSVKNMHRTFTYDVKDKITYGENTIRLDFKSPLKYFKKMNDKHYLYINYHTVPGTPHLRKALCMSGWDWGPVLPDMGIFRDVELNAYNTDRIDDVLITQEHTEDGKVILSINANTVHNCENCTMVAEIDGQKAELQNGKAKIVIKNPKLWWPRGFGEQKLYNITVTLQKDGKVIDTDKKRIGLRTITVSTGAHNDNEFCFIVNGVRIFIMGANYIPQDSLVARVTKEKTRKLLEACCDANYNCMRVWGGGYYPEDYFFDLCDEMGLIVWQDFMAACVAFWFTKDFEEDVYREALCNLKRIRHHASLGLLCGNNEVEQGFLEDGLLTATIIADYVKLYEHILPEMVLEYAPDSYYWPSSPSAGGGFKNTVDKDKGDSHYWEVWHSSKPMEEYRKHMFRFCSEYGFESFPPMKTIKSFCPDEEMNPFSRTMDNHQKCVGGNTKILTYLSEMYKYPYNMEDLAYASQLVQADAIKYGVEHFRRTRGYCMGSLYWQVNDCWPVASWSSVDYYGRYKALHYAAKKFYAPVAVGLFHENGKITVNIANEQMSDFKGTLKMYMRKNNFELIHSRTADVEVEKLSSADVSYMSDKYVDDKHNCYFYADLYDENGNFVMRQTLLFTKPKHFEWQKPNISAECENCNEGVKIKLKSDTFAKYVYLDFEDMDVIFTDNYVDITDENPVTVIAKTNEDCKIINEKLKIKTVYDIGR